MSTEIDDLYARDRQIAKMRAEGKSLNTIAATVGLTQSGVSHAINRMGLAGPPNERDIEADAEVLKRRKAGQTWKEIATALGVDPKIARRRLKQLQADPR